MKHDLIMPLGGLLDKLLRGEAEEWCETDLGFYLESLTHGDKKDLEQVLEVVDAAIDNWKSLSFISRYEDKIKEWEEGKCSMDEVDELYFEEESWRKEGKKLLTTETLYAAISNKGFINDYHRDAIEDALGNNDIRFLKTDWENMVLAQIKCFKDIIIGRLEVASVKPITDKQSAVRVLKKLDDYPEILDAAICSEFLGISKYKLYKLTSARKIPFYKDKGNGRKLYFKRDEVHEWRIARRQGTNEEYVAKMEAGLATRFLNSL